MLRHLLAGQVFDPRIVARPTTQLLIVSEHREQFSWAFGKLASTGKCSTFQA